MENNGFLKLVGILAMLLAWNFVIINWDAPISNPWFIILPSVAVVLVGPLLALIQPPSWKRGTVYLSVGFLEGLLAFTSMYAIRDGGPGLPAGALLGAALSIAAGLCGFALIGRYARARSRARNTPLV